MKTFQLLLCTLIIFFVAYPGTIFSQTSEGLYMNVDYIEIPKSEVQNFENDEQRIKTIQKARIANNSLHHWTLYRVLYKGSENSAYNYVAVSVSDTPRAFENILHQIRDSTVDASAEEMTTTYYKWLSANHSELWKIENSITKIDSIHSSKYFSIDYMEVGEGMEYAYRMMEDEVARPIHEYRMDTDRMRAWQLYSLLTPGGITYGHNFATGNFYNNLENIEFGFTEEIIRQTNPETDMTEFFENINRTRDLVRSEVWELVYSVH